MCGIFGSAYMINMWAETLLMLLFPVLFMAKLRLKDAWFCLQRLRTSHFNSTQVSHFLLKHFQELFWSSGEFLKLEVRYLLLITSQQNPTQRRLPARYYSTSCLVPVWLWTSLSLGASELVWTADSVPGSAAAFKASQLCLEQK